jgi:NAD(P)-dependent dehydrogenase (short-subunit alcohol dehydrogenase family)
MRIVVVGATGTIGRAVVDALGGHEVVKVSHRSTPLTVDIADPDSIAALYRRLGSFDALVCAAGSARMKALTELTEDDFAFSLGHKLMGQVNLVRLGLDQITDEGSFTLTSGVLARNPMPGSAAISTVNAGLEGFTRAAALEFLRGIRINIVSPPWVTETLEAMGLDTRDGLPAAAVARAYLESITGSQTGSVLEPKA